MKIFGVFLVLMFMISGCGGMKEQIERDRKDVEKAEVRFNASRQDVESIRCKGKDECARIFRIASDLVAELSDMKIQTATENYIATFNPIRVGMVGMTARKALGLGDGEEIKVDINCSHKYTWEKITCLNKSARIYEIYKLRIDLHLLGKD